MLSGIVANAESISDKLIAAIVEKNLAQVLYLQNNKPWQMGTYNLRINKSGSTIFSGSASLLKLSLSIEAIVKGNVRQTLMGRQLTMTCYSSSLPTSILKSRTVYAPAATAPLSRLRSLYQNGLRRSEIPIKPLLEKLVAENKRNWERDLELDINNLFDQVGI